MKKFTLTIINILTLSSCGIDQDDYNNTTQQTDNYMKCIKYFIFIRQSQAAALYFYNK